MLCGDGLYKTQLLGVSFFFKCNHFVLPERQTNQGVKMQFRLCLLRRYNLQRRKQVCNDIGIPCGEGDSPQNGKDNSWPHPPPLLSLGGGIMGSKGIYSPSLLSFSFYCIPLPSREVGTILMYGHFM